MISHKYKCIFVHQRKAAGTTVKSLFPDAVGSDLTYLNDGILDSRWHTDANVVQEYYKFTVVRNPWTRFLSAWKYCNATRFRSIKDVLLNLPSENVLSDIFRFNRSWPSRFGSAYCSARTVINGRTLRKPGSLVFWLGHDYIHLTRPQTASLTYADQPFVVDKVVYFEDLENGLLDVMSTVGMPKTKLPRLNSQSEYLRPSGAFDEESQDLFRQQFRRDLELLGYPMHV